MHLPLYLLCACPTPCLPTRSCLLCVPAPGDNASRGAGCPPIPGRQPRAQEFVGDGGMKGRRNRRTTHGGENGIPQTLPRLAWTTLLDFNRKTINGRQSFENSADPRVMPCVGARAGCPSCSQTQAAMSLRNESSENVFHVFLLVIFFHSEGNL